MARRRRLCPEQMPYQDLSAMLFQQTKHPLLNFSQAYHSQLHYPHRLYSFCRYSGPGFPMPARFCFLESAKSNFFFMFAEGGLLSGAWLTFMLHDSLYHRNTRSATSPHTHDEATAHWTTRCLSGELEVRLHSSEKVLSSP